MREFTERMVMALLQASGLLAMPKVVKSVAALSLLSARVLKVASRTMLLPLIRAMPVAVPSSAVAYPRTLLVPDPEPVVEIVNVDELSKWVVAPAFRVMVPIVRVAEMNPSRLMLLKELALRVRLPMLLFPSVARDAEPRVVPVVPSIDPELMLRVPPRMLVVPVKALVPTTDQRPEPVLMRFPLRPRSWMPPSPLPARVRFPPPVMVPAIVSELVRLSLTKVLSPPPRVTAALMSWSAATDELIVMEPPLSSVRAWLFTAPAPMV